MKRILFIGMLILLASSIWAGGKTEDQTTTEDPIIWLTVVGTRGPLYEAAASRFLTENGNVRIKNISADISTGATVTMDVLKAAHLPSRPTLPNLYTEFTGRASKFMEKYWDFGNFALPLQDLYPDLDQFIPAEIAKYDVDGDILGVPVAFSSHGLAVNLEIMEEIGYTVPDGDWTIAEFLKMCELVKRKYGGEKFGTGLFAANPSGDYLMNNWFASFGADMYPGGDYSKAGLDSPEALETFKFWDTLMKRGYVPPESAVLTDDDFVLDMGAGRYATAIFRSGWVDIYNKNAQNAGLIDHAYPYKFVQMPVAPGVTKPKAISGGGGTIVVFDSGDDATNEMAVRLAWFLSNAEYQAALTEGGAYPSRTDVQIHPETLANPHWQVINKITMKNGLMTVGYTQQWFYEVRSQMFPVNQKLLNGEYTPAQAQQAYVQAVNKIIREN